MPGTKIGFDLGASSVIAVVDGKGIKINEPAVIAYDTFTEKIKAIGDDAYRMIGKSPDSLTVIRPMREGSVFNYDSMQHMLVYYIQKLCGNRIFKPSVTVCVPSGATDLEKRTVLDLVTSSGAARACVIEEPLAAAVGAGVDCDRIGGQLVVDIGGGTTDIAVVTEGCIAKSLSVNVAGSTFDGDIMRYARRERDTVIGSLTAENVKLQVGAAVLPDAELAVRVVGKDYSTNLPKSIELSSTEVYECIKEHLEQLVDAIRSLLEQTSPELNADVLTNGIVLTGGGALLRGMDKYIAERTGIRTVCAKEPLLCVANGLGKIMQDEKLLKKNGYEFISYIDIKNIEE